MARSDAGRWVAIIPARDEATVLPLVLAEIRHILGPVPVVVGANGCTDGTAEVARRHGAEVAETAAAGYGLGCLAAIALADRLYPEAAAYVFMAADGANDPRDVDALLAAYRHGFTMVIGSRTRRGLPDNVGVMGRRHWLANRLFGFWCGLLTGHPASDLCPLPLIDQSSFCSMGMAQPAYGWTIEAQVKAARLHLPVCEVPVRERRRLAGVQKISRVHAWHSLRIAARIFGAGWSCRWTPLPSRVLQAPASSHPSPVDRLE